MHKLRVPADVEQNYFKTVLYIRSAVAIVNTGLLITASLCFEIKNGDRGFVPLFLKLEAGCGGVVRRCQSEKVLLMNNRLLIKKLSHDSGLVQFHANSDGKKKILNPGDRRQSLNRHKQQKICRSSSFESNPNSVEARILEVRLEQILRVKFIDDCNGFVCRINNVKKLEILFADIVLFVEHGAGDPGE
jgi:hypothetical protein